MTPLATALVAAVLAPVTVAVFATPSVLRFGDPPGMNCWHTPGADYPDKMACEARQRDSLALGAIGVVGIFGIGLLLGGARSGTFGRAICYGSGLGALGAGGLLIAARMGY